MRRRLIIGLVTAPLLVGIFALWLASSEMALQWAAKRVSEASHGTVTVTGLSGSLAHSLRIDHLRYQSPKQVIHIEKAEFTWSPLQLLRARLAVNRLSASTLTIERLKPSDEPPALPIKLRLPLDLQIDQAHIDKAVFFSAGSRIEWRDLHGRLAADKERWQLHDLSVDSEYGRIRGEAMLGTQRPFPLKGVLQFTHDQAQASANLTGNLDEMSLNVSFSGYEAHGEAKAVAKPFDRTPLRELALTARGINPAKMKAEWPQADLHIAMNLKAGSDGALKGALALTNSQPGLLDQQQLPLRSASMQLAGTLNAAQLDNVTLDFGKAGKFTGGSKPVNNETVLTLRTQNFDLHGLSGKMKSTRLAGDIVLTDKNRGQTLAARFGQQRLRLNVRATREDHLLRLDQVTLRADNGELRLSGNMNLTDMKPFALNGMMRHFNPATFGAYPVANLNLDFGLQGHLTPEWQLALHYAIQPSQLFNHPLTGRGSLNADAKHVHGVNAMLALGPNSLSASGNFGMSADRLQWQIDAPRLAVFGKQFNGVLKGKGELGGTLSSPSVSLLLEGSDLLLDGYGARTLRASAQIGEGQNSPLHAEIHLNDAFSQGIPLQTLQASLSGTRQQHRLQLDAHHKEGAFKALAVGGWRPENGWSGTVESLQNQGKYAFSLKQPTPLQIDSNGYAFQNLTLGLANGSVRIDTFKKAGAQLLSRGTATGVPLPWLITLTPDLEERLYTDLVIGADWSLEGDHAALNGKLRVFREAGDVTLHGNTPTTFGLTALEAQARIEKNALQAELTMRGKNVGTLQVDARSQLARKQGAWTLPKQSPLHLNVHADMPSLAWLDWMGVDQGIEADGKLALNLTGRGTIGNPGLSGDILGDNLTLRWAEQGIQLRDGVLRAALQNDRLQIQQASFQGTEGTLRIEGNARTQDAQLVIDMRLIADKLMLLSRPDRLLVVSGSSTLSLDQSRLLIGGQMQADRARLEFPELDSVTISEDVVVIGQDPSQNQARKALPIRYDLAFNLGRNFHVKGQGLDALLSGSVQVFSTPDRLPNARGTIQVAEGTYKAYGQKLEIQRGLITFNGPINNPALNMLAVRKAPAQINAVEAGIVVRGTALAPRARLVSTPEVPDTEKLSWLVLGKGTNMANQKDFNVLGAAASALFGSEYAASLHSGLAATFGIDEFSISNATELDNAIVLVGKRLSSRFYLIFEQSISGATSVAKLRYLLSRRLRVEVGAGTMSTFDLIYNWRFD